MVLVLFTANVFIENIILEYVVGTLAIPMLLFSVIGATKLFRILGAVFITVGTGLYVYAGLSFYEVPLYLTSTMPLLTFLMVLPWMNSIVRAARFDRRINELMKANVTDLSKLYVRSSFTTYILASFINLSALSLAQGVLLENMSKMKKKIQDSFISRTTLRAFALALAWSPMEIIVAITVDATGIGYLSYLPWLLLCSFLMLSIDWFWGKRAFNSITYTPTVERGNHTLNFRRIAFKIVHLLYCANNFHDHGRDDRKPFSFELYFNCYLSHFTICVWLGIAD